MKQASFLPKLRTDHGGDLRKGKRKTARPFSHKNAIHLVLRSVKARGSWSLLTRANESRIEKLLEKISVRHHISVYRFENVGNHLHLLVKTERRAQQEARKDLGRFLKQFAGEVAFQVTGAKKGKAQGGFWEKLVYSRIVSWGKEYDRLKAYLTKNFLESKGLWAGRWVDPALESMMAAGVGPPS